jgi:hypothetical protein
MDSNRFENTFFNTYYYSNIINNILSGDVELIGFISNFFDASDYYFVKPYQKDTAFHMFIHITVNDFFINDMNEHDQEAFENQAKHNDSLQRLYAEKVFEEFNVNFPFKDEGENRQDISMAEIEEYQEEIMLTGYIEDCVDRITEQVFHLLFTNREMAFKFNYYVSNRILEVDMDEIDDELIPYFSKVNKRLIRKSPPTWAKKAIYFRDRGRCCDCNKDLSGTLSLLNKDNFDHIIPLEQGGINDVSNLQLLCDNCNAAKRGDLKYVSKLYEKWF